MTVTLRATAPRHEDQKELQLSNGCFDWLLRHRVFMPAGYLDLGLDSETNLPMLWTPIGASGSAHDGWPVKETAAQACADCVETLAQSLTYGLVNERPWATALDRQHHPMLQPLMEFLDGCGGFTTS